MVSILPLSKRESINLSLEKSLRFFAGRRGLGDICEMKTLWGKQRFRLDLRGNHL